MLMEEKKKLEKWVIKVVEMEESCDKRHKASLPCKVFMERVRRDCTQHKGGREAKK